MTTIAEHQRCDLARAYRAAITLDQRRRLAVAHGLTLKELALLAR